MMTMRLSAFCLAPALLAAANAVSYTMWTPDILTLAQTAPMTLEVTVTAEASAVSFVHAQDAPRPLRNDGQGGDRIAGDRVFTIRFEAAELLAWYGVFEAKAFSRTSTPGSVRVTGAGGALLTSVSINLPVKTDAAPRVAVTPLASNAQYSPHVFNVAMPLSYFAPTGLADAPATQAFYSHFHDAFEFIALVLDGNVPANSQFTIAQENTSGIGTIPIALDPALGSAGKLEGIVHLYGDVRFDTATGCATTLLHEIGHRWINQLDGPLDDPHGSHWPLGSLAGGIMGFSASGAGANGPGIAGLGNLVPDGNDLQAQPFRACPRYNDMDLYLMGLRAPSQVSPSLVAVDQNQIPQGSPFPRIAGPFNTVAIQSAIAANGPRVPSFPSAPRQFRAATILVTPGRLASPELMHWIESQAVYLDSVFFDATGGVGRMRTEIDSARFAFPVAGPRIVAIRNAASLIGGPLAPGSLIRIEGSGLGPSLPVEAALEENLPGPTTLASTRIVINGRPAVLLSVSAASVTAIVPSDLPVTQSADVQAERALDIGTLRSNSVTMPLARFSPAVFSRNGLGAGAALAFNQDGTPNTFENPAISPGTIDLIVNGAGPVDPRLPDGFLVPSNSRPAALPSSVEVFFRAAPANVVSATNIPGEISNKARIRFQVPVIGDGVVESSIFVRIGGVVAPAGTRVFARKP